MELLLALLIGGFIIGIISSIFGGGMFLSIPFWQYTMPQINYGQLIANIKIGSFFRGIFGILATKRHIQLKEIKSITIIFVISSIIGSLFIVNVNQKYLIIAVISAIIISELAPKISHLINKKTQLSMTFLLGIYNGIAGAGIGLLIPSLLRINYPNNDQIVHTKIQAQFIETIGTGFAVITHIYYGNLIFPLWISWCIGNSLGGYVGSHFLKKSIKIDHKKQIIYLRILYIIALLPFLIQT